MDICRYPRKMQEIPGEVGFVISVYIHASILLRLCRLSTIRFLCHRYMIFLSNALVIVYKNGNKRTKNCHISGRTLAITHAIFISTWVMLYMMSLKRVSFAIFVRCINYCVGIFAHSFFTIMSKQLFVTSSLLSHNLCVQTLMVLLYTFLHQVEITT